jgi:hypothetical protein
VGRDPLVGRVALPDGSWMLPQKAKKLLMKYFLLGYYFDAILCGLVTVHGSNALLTLYYIILFTKLIVSDPARGLTTPPGPQSDFTGTQVGRHLKRLRTTGLATVYRVFSWEHFIRAQVLFVGWLVA